MGSQSRLRRCFSGRAEGTSARFMRHGTGWTEFLRFTEVLSDARATPAQASQGNSGWERGQRTVQPIGYGGVYRGWLCCCCWVVAAAGWTTIPSSTNAAR
ncbi:conserved protein of unknown function [Ectopseudomonas oleovorans]|uniref:Uncharacterized protein n=1 Tax=Ectopseudomonas oleovorans TaxID=301 RepID=A0A653B7G0_ECTOL|nr:conserved protein of unknown function [Pseudomonas oleovorans]